MGFNSGFKGLMSVHKIYLLETEHDRKGSRNSWCRSMCATFGLFETTNEGLLNSKF